LGAGAEGAGGGETIGSSAGVDAPSAIVAGKSDQAIKTGKTRFIKAPIKTFFPHGIEAVIPRA
jgi:hypothetical protein